MTYSLDMRKQVLKIRREEGLSMAEVAERFGVGVASVMRWSKNIECVKKRNRSSKIDKEALKQDVEQYPDAYQFERATRLGVSEYCVWYALKHMGITYKKKLCSIQRQPQKNDLPSAKRCKNIRKKAVHLCLLMNLASPMTCRVSMVMRLKDSAVLALMTGAPRAERM